MTASGDRMISVSIRRADPACGKEPWIEEYKVPRSRARRVLDLLEYIQEELDPSLGWRTHICRDTCCSACWVMVNGKRKMACATVIRDDQDSLLLEPVSDSPLIRDLVVDFSKGKGRSGS